MTQRRPAFPTADCLAGLALAAALTLAFWLTDWDRQTAHWFLSGATPWPGRSWAWSELLYRFGPAAADLCGAAGAAAFALSFGWPPARRWRGPGLYLALLLLAGPGLLSNLLAKGLAGRPRPVETAGFGGAWGFRRPFDLGVPGKGMSFLSGHASNAWYFLGLAFLFPRRRRAAVAGACAFGCAMGLARVSQGAHWLSDVLLPAPLIWALAAALSPLIHWQPPARLFRRPAFLAALACAVLACVALSGVRYEDRRFSGPTRAAGAGPTWRALAQAGPARPREVDVEADLRVGDLEADFEASPPAWAGPGSWPLTLAETFQGQGLPGSRDTLVAEPLPLGGPIAVGPDALAVRFAQRTTGFWFVVDERVRLGLPEDLDLDARLRDADGVLTIGGLPPGRRVLLAGLPEGQAPPPGFTPFGGGSWVRPGRAPLITLDVRASAVRFADVPASR